MYRPSLDELECLSTDYKIVPVSKELFADSTTPIQVLQRLKTVSEQVYLFESVENKHHWGRYSFLGFNPSLEITCKQHQMNIKSLTTKFAKSLVTDNPNREIRKILEQYTSPTFDFLPSFTGGFVGYFAYEYLRYSERKLDFINDEMLVNDVDLMLFDKVIAFDHYKQKIVLIVNIKTDDLKENYQKAKKDLDFLADLVINGKVKNIVKGRLLSEFNSEFSPRDYEQVVDKVQNYIKEGDIFQAVISNCLSAKFTGSLYNSYRVLRTTNPSPYMFYLSSDDIELTGASPETLIKLQQGELMTFPIAGTKPRGKNKIEDNLLAESLLQDEKELAEHNMLVDLGRNDLGKISEFNSVLVEYTHKIEHFSHVMHLTSKIKSKLKANYDALDAITATLPAGTLSGAPKIRAMEIIHELEKSPRGIYGGAIGYIDFTGNMDMCIGIRMAMAKDNKVYVRSGGGIVKDSIPSCEYQETVNKAKSMIEAIKIAQEVVDNDFVN